MSVPQANAVQDTNIALEPIPIPAGLLKSVLNYLGSRPYCEVSEGIVGLQKAIEQAIAAKKE